MAKIIRFIGEAFKDMASVGTIVPSSKQLGKRLAEELDYNNAEVFVELGAGNGIITRCILERMRPDQKLYAFEINAFFLEQLSEIEDDRLTLVDEDAQNIELIMNKLGYQEVDGIVSALPFTNMPKEVGASIIEGSKKVLAKNANFIQINYSLLRRKWYTKFFNHVDVSFFLNNLPPVFIFKMNV